MNLTPLDNAFSLYIRLKNVDSTGYGRCCTSGKRIHYTKGHCGHFISRRHLSTRWDERNCALQSVSDNIFNQGKQFEFGLYIDKKYGAGTSTKLLALSRVTSHIGQFEINELAKYYRKEVKRLKTEKGLK